MKKTFIILGVMTSSLAFSQIGINTTTPVSSLDVTAKNATGTTTNVDGLLVPRVDRQRAQSMTGTPVSTLIYVNSIATGSAAGTAINIDETGYYYFDGTAWTKLKTPAGVLATTIYNADGSLSGNRTVTQNANTLTFTGTSVNSFSVDGNTFSVDALNNRVGMGTASPLGRFHLYNSPTGTDEGNDYLLDDESSITQTHGLILRRSRSGNNLSQNDFIGSVVFNPKINGAFNFTGAGIAGVYRGDGTNSLTALSLRINSNQEAARIDENGRVGIGTASPAGKLNFYNPTDGTDEGNDYLFDDESLITQSQGIVLRRSRSGNNLSQNDLIGGLIFNPKINGAFNYFGAGMAGIYRGDGTNPLIALSLRINSNQEAARIDENGNVGIGTSTPTAKLHTVGSAAYTAFQMQDGSQGANKVLVSDNNGRATWQASSAITPSVLGTLNTTTKNVTNNLLIGSSINLTPGKWIIYIGQIIQSSTAATTANNLWMRITLSSSNVNISETNYTYLGSHLVSGWLSPSVGPSGGFSFLSGVIPVNVTGNVTLYSWFSGNDSAGTPPAANVSGNGENYLFAVPMN